MVPVVSSSSGVVIMRVYESESLAAKSIPFVVIFKPFVKKQESIRCYINRKCLRLFRLRIENFLPVGVKFVTGTNQKMQSASVFHQSKILDILFYSFYRCCPKVFSSIPSSVLYVYNNIADSAVIKLRIYRIHL
jgi:hypothetical protein